jgi:hypothetical protein
MCIIENLSFGSAVNPKRPRGHLACAIMKDFASELQKFVQMIVTNRQFALGRFADGEGCILLNMGERQGGWLNRERVSSSWRHIPGNPSHEAFRTRLREALAYSAHDYYIGLPCRSGHAEQYAHFFSELKALTSVPEEQLTFARLFHSYNYHAFNNAFLPAVFARQKVFLVCNERADSSGIPHVFRRWDVPAENASLSCSKTIRQIKEYLSIEKPLGGTFLISAGPSAAVIAHELWSFNRDNTYVDIGSTLDPVFFHASPCRGLTRTYLHKISAGDTDIQPFTWG